MLLQRALHRCTSGAARSIRHAAVRPQRVLTVPLTRDFAIASTASTGSKSKGTAYVCNSCGADYQKWAGKCNACGEWNTLKAFVAGPATAAGARNVSPSVLRAAHAQSSGDGVAGWLPKTSASSKDALVPLSAVKAASYTRIPTGSRELDRVFGGGLSPGGVTLLAGNPGIGKSTLLLQLAALLSDATRSDSGLSYRDFFKRSSSGDVGSGADAAAPPSRTTAPAAAASSQSVVVFVSGEESIEQIKSRADRLRVEAPHMMLLNETRVETILEALNALHVEVSGRSPPCTIAAVIIDSVQTMFTDSVAAAAGTVSQVRESAVRLLHFAKLAHVPLFLVGHVTKTGDIAGPRVLEHLVDTVIYIEAADDGAVSAPYSSPASSSSSGYGASGVSTRLMRTVKNRFGSTSEVGLFEMTEDGLMESHAARLFLSNAPTDEAMEGTDGTGVGVAVAVEGTRPLCVEVQALASRSVFPYPRHRASGLALERVFMLTAVLTRHARMRMHHDLYVNVVGGLRLFDPAADLALVCAIASSISSARIPPRTVLIGELGLSGEVRPVSRLSQRIAAAAVLGFTHAIIPDDRHRAAASSDRSAAGIKPPPGFKLTRVRTLRQALEAVFGSASLATLQREGSHRPPHVRAREPDMQDEEGAGEPDDEGAAALAARAQGMLELMRARGAMRAVPSNGEGGDPPPPRPPRAAFEAAAGAGPGPRQQRAAGATARQGGGATLEGMTIEEYLAGADSSER